MDSADEAKQEFPFVAVTTIGGNSPKWLKNFPGLDGKPDVEIVIGRNARDKRTAASFEIEVPAPKAPARIFIIDETFSSQDFQFSDAIWIICAHARDLDTIAETCAWYAHYGVFRGRSLRDALRIGGGAGDRSRVGRGVAVSGICDENAVRSVKRALHKFAQASFDGSVVLIHGLSSISGLKLDVEEFYAFINKVLTDCEDKDNWANYYRRASSSKWTVLAFRKPVPKVDPNFS